MSVILPIFNKYLPVISFLMLLQTALLAGGSNSLNKTDNAVEISIRQIEGQPVFFSEQHADSVLVDIQVNGQSGQYLFKNNISRLPGIEFNEKGQLIFLKYGKKNALFHISSPAHEQFRIKHIPLWLSIVPPALAIILALLFKEVVLALFIGLFAGVFIAGGIRIDSFYHFFLQYLYTVSDYILPTLTDEGHMAVIVFSIMIGGMVAVISKNGGMAGIVLQLSKYAKTPVSTQVITWLMGIVIFFDDYANTLIVGNTMRNITDKFRISREKLAYIVDSTAAPVAAIAFITTWIGAELGYIADGIKNLDGIDPGLTPYALFLQSLQYAYYPVLTLIFVIMLIVLRREYGPMHRAESNARNRTPDAPEEQSKIIKVEDVHFTPSESTPKRWLNGIIPIITLIGTTIFGLLYTGMETSSILLLEKGIQLKGSSWTEIWNHLEIITGDGSGIWVKTGYLIGNANSFTALLWGSIAGLGIAIGLSLVQRLMNVIEAFSAMTHGFKSMVPALLILALAWSLAMTTNALHTAEFITSSLEGLLQPEMMPAVVFCISALIAFSTGSSWSTMAILFPIALPAAWSMSMASGLDPAESTQILVNVTSAIMGASVMGDHMSPISDTTILSSLASGCNHLEHVRTQLPYALTVGIVALLSTLISAFFGNPLVNILILGLGILLLYFILIRFGKKIQSTRF